MRTLRAVAASMGLALVVVTCVDNSVGPGRQGVARLNFSALAPGVAGVPLPVPVESLEITLQRSADVSMVLDTTLGFRSDTAKGDSGVVRLHVPLRESPEEFQLSIRAFGRGVDWYTASSTVKIAAGAAAPSAALTVRYVGPGANALRVAMAPTDTTAIGGMAFALHATVFDSSGKAIAGVPVAYRLSDTSRASVSYPTPYSGLFTGRPTVRDSVWVVAETPTHLKDSTRVHLLPPAASLAKKSGDLQSSIVAAPLPAPLTVRVLDALGGGFKGDTVRWTVTAGAATLSVPFAVSDDSGFAAVTATPTAVGALTVQAAVSGLAGSPVTFSETAISGTIKTVTITPKIDTIANGATLVYTAVAKDAGGGSVSTTFGWTSTVPAIATIGPTSGLATALAGDSTRIIATAGGVSDTARLYVRALRTLVVSPADTTITAVGDSLLLRATATDNFGAAMTAGLNIRYLSASPAIALVNAVTGRVKITGPGNGVILVRDSAPTSDSLVRASATLRVNQVTAGILNNPTDSLIVGVSGQSQVVATALDSNNYPIPAKTFGWAARLGVSGGTVASVTSSGLVTGVALGTAYVVDSLVEGTVVFKDSTKVIVSAAPPKLLQWAFDSTSVGNGGSVSIGLALTTPATAPLTISIKSSDSTIAKATPNTVTIGAGSSATSVVIYGLKAGSAVLTATDVSGQGYSSKQMTVGVVSTITFRETANPCCQQQYFYLNQNETHKAQVWLSDPAPPGGLGITFVYGKAGTSVVSPSPALIPAGQLSADVTFQGVAGSAQPDSVVPTSGGYIGKFSYVYVAPDSLRLTPPYPGTGLLGVGQYGQPNVQITYAMDHPLVIAAALSSPIGTTAPLDTIATGGTIATLAVAAKATGVDTLTVTAPGWVSGKTVFTFTTPQLVASGQTSIIAGSPSDGYWSVTPADSTRYPHPVSDSLAVTITAKIANPLDTAPPIAIDTPSTAYVPKNAASVARYGVRALAGGGGDSAWVVATAPGYRPDSFKVYVTKPTLQLAPSYPSDARVALGTLFQNGGYVTIPYQRTDTFWVVFTHTQKAAIAGPDSVRILKGQTVGYFDVTGAALGVDTITVTRATGYQVQGSSLVWTVDSLHVRPYSYPSTLVTISPAQLVTVEAVDAVDGYPRPLVAALPVTLQSSNTNAFTLDASVVTIPAGQYISGPDSLRVAGVDSGRVIVTAAGSARDSTPLIHVTSSALTVAFGYPGSGYVGRGLKLPGNYVYIPAAAPNSLTVSLQRYNPSKDSLSAATVVIPKGSSSSGGFDLFGLDSTGTDSITAAAAGFVTGRATVHDTAAGLQLQGFSASHLTTEPSQAAYVYTRMRAGYTQSPITPLLVSVLSTDSNVIRIDSGAVRGDSGVVTVSTAGNAVFRVRYVGTGTARIRVAAAGFDADSSVLISVTGASLHLGYTTVTVGQGQIFQSEYVYLDNAVTGGPLVVHLTRSDSTVFGIAPDSVVIPVGSSSSAAFDVSGLSTGASQLTARASGYNQATATVSVGQARLVAGTKLLTQYVGAPATTLPVYVADQTGAGRIVAMPTIVGDSSSQPAVLVSDSAVRTIATRGSTTYFAVTGLKKGSAQIVYSSPNYRSDTTVVSVDTAPLVLNGAPTGLGPNQVAQMYVSIPYSATAPLTVTLGSTNSAVATVPSSAVIPTGSYYVYFNVTGTGLGTTQITAAAPGLFYAATPVAVTTGQPKLVVSAPSILGVLQQGSVTVYAEDANGATRNVSQDLTVNLSSSDLLNALLGAPTITIPAGSSSATTTLTFLLGGAYTITATATGYTSGVGSTTAQ